ncbi:unnamed protein product [Closterium sp. NIES-65]|nr:unnamed protein product [Closterium sp. NIES-65]
MRGAVVAQAAAASAPPPLPAHCPVVDAHLHVWANEAEARTFPFHPGQEPTIPGDVALLLKSMDEAGVQGAIITQPINHKFDHSYVTHAMRQHPSRFIGSCLADPTAGGGGARELERLIQEEGYQCVRFNPYLWPDGEKMTNGVGQEMFSRAGELGAPVAFMCFKGFHLHADEIEQLCTAHPHTRVILDHFGFCRNPNHPSATAADRTTWNRLLSLARFPQVYVKTSAHFRVSREPYPYSDTWEQVQDLIKTFGAHRLLWGSDFPFVVMECGYKESWDLLQSITNGLSNDERSWIRGATAASLFPNAWKA